MLKISSENIPTPNKSATIKPVTPRISRPTRKGRNYRPLIVGVSTLTAIVLALSALLLFPERTIDANSSAILGDQSVQDSLDRPDFPSPSEDGSTTPFQDLTLERAKASAENTLSKFSKLQDSVESRQLGLNLYEEDYNAIIDTANQADTLFSNREFPDALKNYEEATTSLEQYVETIEDQYSNHMNDGNIALQKRQVQVARDSFDAALELLPDDSAALEGLEKVALLPKVNDLIREAERAALRGQFGRAKNLYLEAQMIDPIDSDFNRRIVELSQHETDEQFRALLSRAYVALSKQQLHEARGIFEVALVQRPADTSAQTGMQQVQQAQVSKRIIELKNQAESYESQGSLMEALRIYEEVLELDDNIQFAREGSLRIRALFDTLGAMDRIIADPDMLSSEHEFGLAKEILTRTREHFGHDPSYDEKVVLFTRLIETASIELPLTLESDNTVDVRLSTVGDLGTFIRRQLQLRPGRYQLSGSADGCRDIRKTIVVRKDMDSISITCNEPI